MVELKRGKHETFLNTSWFNKFSSIFQKKIEIFMPSIIKDINGKINITLPEHILPSQIKKDQIIMPQLLNISPKTLDKDHDKSEVSKERRSTRTKKPPDKLTY